ncbi:MAG: DNA mismatch repair endonuclease MutL [Nitrospiraceae bacterium]|nr:DNA mismatch repair endonuclease MutL [Nitrospiraceae bacterium]
MSVASGIGKIRVLPGEVISRIAAGEVVERPAAVVKELIDNSLDAGSTRVTVDVTDGGRRSIRVSDDGEGMTPADAPLAFQRHATSKLRSEHDLFTLRTLGFRGEALPCIASVSKVRLVTACRTEPVGTRLLLTGGALTKCEETAAAPGTQIDVEELFFNTPARRKFLKTTTTEFSHICQAVQQAALAWPGTRFRLTHNGQDVADYPAAVSRRDRILQVYGMRFVEQAAVVSGERAGIRVEGLTIQPMHSRAGRNPQELFVNRRAVKNAAVSHAVYDAYGTYLAKGQHPQFVLFLDVDSERVDVNVHPTKREVRFADQDLVFQAVRQAVRAAIGAEAKPEAVTRHWSFVDREPMSSQAMPGLDQQMLTGMAGGMQPAGSTVQESSQAYPAGVERDIIPLGQLSRTYLVAQVGSELHVIDQHTAHERVLFERLCRARLGQALPAQPLLIPETIDVPAQHAVLLQRHLPELEQAGLTIEPFGAHTFVIRAVPALLKPLDYAALVLDLVDDLSQWNQTSPLETRLRSVMASLACHGAVRAGRAMELPEIKRLIEEWVDEGLPTTCPHGRRVALRLPEDELARIFGRA